MKRLVKSEDSDLSKLKDLYNQAYIIADKYISQLSNDIGTEQAKLIIEEAIDQIAYIFEPELTLNIEGNIRKGYYNINFNWNANGYTGSTSIDYDGGLGLMMFVEDLTMAYYRKVLKKDDLKTPILIKKLKGE